MATKADFTQEEWEAMQKGITGAGMLVAISDRGFFDSFKEASALAKHLGERMLHGGRALTFAIGGADGLPRALVARAGLRLSLSAMTLPHRMARLVLLEQIYRALTIIRGEPYHH